jgi:hypothetical protein
MFETVTVDEALRKGKRSINIPIYIILFGMIGLSVYFVSVQSFSGWYNAAGVTGGFVFAWLYWSFAITRWRLWAFENVRNVHELKQRAIKETLIWPDDSFFNRTEIRTADQTQRLISLENKFSRPDIFNDDYSIPPETIVYYSKIKGLLQALTMMLVFAGSLYLIIQENIYIFGGIVSVVSAIFTYTGFAHYNNRVPQIVISNSGVQTASVQFYSWEEAWGEDVITRRRGKSSTTYFIYQYPGGNAELAINEFGINKRELEKLLRIYRGRSEKSRTLHESI